MQREQKEKGWEGYDQKESLERLQKWLSQVKNRFPHLDFQEYEHKAHRWLERRSDVTDEHLLTHLVLSALERVTGEEPDWTYVAATFYLCMLYAKVIKHRGLAMDPNQPVKYPQHALYRLIHDLSEEGLYAPEMLTAYSKAEMEELAAMIDFDKDKLFTYIGIKTLADRYLLRNYDDQIMEFPQERWMIIAMYLMMGEDRHQRLKLVKEAYWALSNLYMTVATPTLSNAGKAKGQLSSCFIDTVEDSLRSIYDSNTDAATLSKNGGGLGIYLGKIRSRGSNIRRFKGKSLGVLPWMKQLNNTAVSVDQLGQRQGAIAVYLDVWHIDIFDFLDAKLNNGDERFRTHDLFTGCSIPDLFMEQVQKRGDWYLFDPHEVRQVMGWSLEDFYDEKPGRGSFREKYAACVNEPRLSKEKVPAIEVFKRILKSQLETGTPYMFYRDAANRLNPNKHAGMIYASNLCTEIMQNMSPTVVEEETTRDGKIIITKNPGDFVACNLSSINLARAVTDDVLERLIPIQVRMLDNVIDLNNIEVPQAQLTNRKYRAIGLGTFGWHHLLAMKGIRWESEEAVQYADQLYEQINYLTIKASLTLAKEKGAYQLFQGSDWQTGRYFELRGYTDGSWRNLLKDVQRYGLRNGYLLAVAPNSSTSIIAGSTAGIDPIFKREYVEEKKNYKIPVTAPDLSAETAWYYKSAYHIDQEWSIRQNAARARHIDQGISFNLYVRHDIKAKTLLHLHLAAWSSGLKSTYYVRSTAVEVEGCDSCEA
ncbi:ribonucleoside-diphosphate reductase alpha chain [Caldalkalibacillus uzonensis]|uniref:Ribonucleoside-diphosphate reductase n=1 Tax=Caldalkalibacillus uzonensis TaxID=353224 RepID=A0ABU0CNE4_9BACI|nr:ribonucleoside-diphosphate reductase subunit alpha [Caldalkalibacillus uzonensis]MDQ0337414.1 ribonucleoside-diphosphate reductase alpha chain [Caldalkalibacillus uzonensis]